MVRITVQAPGRPAPDDAELGIGEGLLLGRDPNPARVAAPAGVQIATLTVEAATVSGNHALAWRDGAGTWVQDAGSRHGTWLKLPPRVPVAVPGDGPVELQLTSFGPGGKPAAETAQPDDADWTGRDDYGRAVARAARRWLEARGVAAGVAVRSRSAGTRREDQPGVIALATGDELEIAPTHTMDVRWPAFFAALYRYAARQDLLFEAEEDATQEGMILASRAMRAAHRAVVNAAASGARTLLIVGPSGAGKEGLARAFHRRSERAGAFVARNCSMFSRELLRSELFGAEAGSFTGATARIVGAVDRAAGGTLFLDELGEMPTEVQPMLLRFLDSGEYEALGGYGDPKRADVRIVCATNRDLRAQVQKGDFRADLWYRLSVVSVDVPPLAERPEDIVAYLKLRRLRGGATAHDVLSPEALALAVSHPWEGNWRELGSFAQRLERMNGVVGAADARRALAEVSLEPVRAPAPAAPAATGGQGWPDLAARAVAAWAEDAGKAAPASWDDVKLYVEKYLKPLAFAYLTGAAGDRAARHDLRALADALDSDRGTAQKQLGRYLERFGR